VRVELEQLHHLIEIHRPLIVRSAANEPDLIELSALAAMLHSFYTGVENILKRIVLELDGTLPGGDSWHQDLLATVVHPTAARPSAISHDLRDRLGEYLSFRHVFRHAYSFSLQWEKMAGLVLECDEVFGQLETELDVFLELGPEQS
jgi:hypothetical protein